MFVHRDSFLFHKLTKVNLDNGGYCRVDEGPHKDAAYPSMTRVLRHQLNPALEAWKLKVGPEEAERKRTMGQNRGNSIHSIAEEYLKNNPLPKMLPHVAEMWQTTRKWIDAHIN